MFTDLTGRIYDQEDVIFCPVINAFRSIATQERVYLIVTRSYDTERKPEYKRIAHWDRYTRENA